MPGCSLVLEVKTIGSLQLGWLGQNCLETGNMAAGVPKMVSGSYLRQPMWRPSAVADSHWLLAAGCCFIRLPNLRRALGPEQIGQPNEIAASSQHGKPAAYLLVTWQILVSSNHEISTASNQEQQIWATIFTATDSQSTELWDMFAFCFQYGWRATIRIIWHFYSPKFSSVSFTQQAFGAGTDLHYFRLRGRSVWAGPTQKSLQGTHREMREVGWWGEEGGKGEVLYKIKFKVKLKTQTVINGVFFFFISIFRAATNHFY